MLKIQKNIQLTIINSEVPQPLIFQRFPQLSKSIPWMALGQFPTPVERLTNLEKHLGLESLWIKRDDLSGALYGGNKVRTLEFILAEAKKREADLLIAYSALGSNWPLACVVYAKQQGWPTDVFFLPYPMDIVKRENLELINELSRKVYSAKSKFTFPFLLYKQLARSRKTGSVYLTPPGGVSPTTTLGYVNAALELKEQHENGELPIPDFIFCSLGSGGTAAGISIGLALIGWPTQVIAVRVVDFIVANKFTSNLLIRRTLKLLKRNGVSLPNRNWGSNLRIEHNYFGKGYSQPTDLGEQSIELFKSHENQLLDSTYTGKTFAPIIDLSKDVSFKNKHILFWQTLNSRNLDKILNLPEFDIRN